MGSFKITSIGSIGLLYIIILSLSLCSLAYSDSNWGGFRGVTASIDTIKEKDVADFSKTGGNLIRIFFNKTHLMMRTAPYNFNEDAFSKLDQFLDWCKNYNIKVVISPMTPPGTKHLLATGVDDDLWHDMTYHDLLDRLWSYISQKYHNRNDVIVGYDLLNEPAAKILPFPSKGPSDYNSLIRRLIKTIRKHDVNTPIIVEPPVGHTSTGQSINRLQGIAYLDPPNDPNIIYSPHMYIPGSFTHQGIRKFKTGIKYPGQIGIRYWNKETLREALRPVLEWQKIHNIPIYIGEFSASRYSGESGERYLRDLIDLFEEYSWSWTYHAWREASIWDAEINSADPSNHTQTDKTPRLELLKAAFSRNH